MTGHGQKFGRKKEEAIAALLSQRNMEEAARVAGVGTKTLLRWLQIPEFQAAYRQTRREAFGQATARLQQASSAAVSTLLKIMVDPNAPASTRVRAADSVLDHGAKAMELEDIEARVAALERGDGRLVVGPREDSKSARPKRRGRPVREEVPLQQLAA
jgi:hypothetical protein